MSDLPDYHFRIRENGAAVFRIDTANRQRRIEMEQIATVHLGKGEIRPQGARALTEEDLAAGSRRGARCWPGARWTRCTARSNS